MKKIIVFGATGGTGRQVVEQALQGNYQVTVVVRKPDLFPLRLPQLTVVGGDVLQPDTFRQAMNGQDAVISCLGTQTREPTRVYSEGIQNIADAMQWAGVERLLCLSAIAVVVPPHGSWLVRLVTKHVLQRLFKHLYMDMLRMEVSLSESSFNWTVIRPPQLTNGRKTGRYRTTIDKPIHRPSKISRADLAHYLLSHLTDDATFRAQVDVSY